MTEKEAERLLKQAGQGQTLPRLQKDHKTDGVTSPGEEAFMYYFGILKPAFPKPMRQHKPFKDHGWALDFAWPDRKIVVEVEGVSHRISEGYQKDIVKYNTLAVRGWLLLRITNRMFINNPSAFFALVEQAYKSRENKSE